MKAKPPPLKSYWESSRALTAKYSLPHHCVTAGSRYQGEREGESTEHCWVLLSQPHLSVLLSPTDTGAVHHHLGKAALGGSVFKSRDQLSRTEPFSAPHAKKERRVGQPREVTGQVCRMADHKASHSLQTININYEQRGCGWQAVKILMVLSAGFLLFCSLGTLWGHAFLQPLTAHLQQLQMFPPGFDSALRFNRAALEMNASATPVRATVPIKLQSGIQGINRTLSAANLTCSRGRGFIFPGCFVLFCFYRAMK